MCTNLGCIAVSHGDGLRANEPPSAPHLKTCAAFPVCSNIVSFYHKMFAQDLDLGPRSVKAADVSVNRAK